MSSADGVSNVVTKTMSLAEHEFITGCERLAAAAGDQVRERHAQFTAGDGSVEISYTPLGMVRLGGLLELPRAEVTLSFSDDVSAAARDAFLKRFDQTFQRGGG